MLIFGYLYGGMAASLLTGCDKFLGCPNDVDFVVAYTYQRYVGFRKAPIHGHPKSAVISMNSTL